MTAGVFYAFAGFAVLFSLLVILLRNPITSALSLVASFFCVSGIFVLLHAPFLGVIQILIYAGAILVLFLYVLMLLNVKREKVREYTYGRIAKFIGLIALPVVLLISYTGFDLPEFGNGAVDSNFGSVSSVGLQLLGPYALLFELISLVLLAAILGVVVVTAKQRGELS